MKIDNIVLSVAVVIAMVIAGFAGWSLYPKFNPCPTITTDTIVISDSYWHHIADSLAGLPPKEKIKWLPQDTLYLPSDTVKLPVDSTVVKGMLKEYLSIYKYKWEEEDDTLSALLYTTVNRNMPIKYELSYKFKIPFSTTVNNIDNSTTYNKYVQFGLAMPVYTYKPNTKVNIQDLKLEGTYIIPKGYFGVAWQPNTQIVEARAGATIFKIKQKK